MTPDLTASELLHWWTVTSDNWRRLLAAHPELLEASCDIAGTTNVAGLIQHLIAAEIRYAERIAGQPVTEYADIPVTSVESLYSVHDRAAALYGQLLSANTDWEQRIEFETRTGGRLRASRRSVFLHAILQAIRHYAQLATIARHNGVKPDWPMDFLFLDAERIEP